MGYTVAYDMQNFKKGKWEISKSSDEKRKCSIYLYWLHFLASPVMVWPDCKIKCSWPHWEGEETACKWASNLLLATRLSILYQPFYWSHLFYTDLFIGWFHSISARYKHHLSHNPTPNSISGRWGAASYKASDGEQKDCGFARDWNI